jgi:hypothetical protein
MYIANEAVHIEPSRACHQLTADEAVQMVYCCMRCDVRDVGYGRWEFNCLTVGNSQYIRTDLHCLQQATTVAYIVECSLDARCVHSQSVYATVGQRP